jgi:hypothetical protein
MSNMLKCPNPSCPYVFDPSQVPVGVVLSCPRCGMQFTLGPPAPTANTAPPLPGYPPPPNYPTAPPGYSAPPPPPQEPVNPEFEAVGRTAVEERDPDAPLPGRRKNKAQVFILAGIAAVLMAGTALTVYFKLTQKKDSTTNTVTPFDDLNVGVDTPPEGWARDDSLRVRLGSPYVMSYKRENPEAYMAFGASIAPKGRVPRLSDIRSDLMQPLSKLFVRNRDDEKFTEEAPVAASWLGEPLAQSDPNHPNGFNFRALSTDGLIWKGEAYTVTHKGIAYFWLSWCGENDYEGLKGEFATFRGKFKLLEMRKDWQETQSNVIDFKGDKVPYTISDAEELWKEIPAGNYPPLKNLEPDLDRRLWMHITPKRGPKTNPHTAELSVYVLDGNGDPLQVARKYVEDMETARMRAANPDLTPPVFKERTSPPEGDPSPTTAYSATPIVRLESHVKEALNSDQLFVISGAKVGDKIVIVRCNCDFIHRRVFETKFVQIASSLR